LFDKHRIKMSSFMIGRAVDKAPDLAREIVRRGHEAAAHGRTWRNSYALDADAERRFIADGVESIVKATGKQPIGWKRVLDAPIRREPWTFCKASDSCTTLTSRAATSLFIVTLKGGDFRDGPGIRFISTTLFSFPFVGWSAAAYEQALRDEFDQLSTRRARSAGE